MIFFVFIGITFILSGIALSIIKIMDKVENAKPKFNPEIEYHQRMHITKMLQWHETGFIPTPDYMLDNLDLYDDYDGRYNIEFIDNSTKLRLKVYKVSNYSDITGIKNYRGFLFSLMEYATVIKNYTELHEFIDDYKSNIPLLLKQQKIQKSLQDLEKDFI
jgi:hypothetical protein